MGGILKRVWHQGLNLYKGLSVAQIFLIIALIVGGVFVVKTPPLWGGDETSHYARAYEIAGGGLVTPHIPYPYGGKSYGDRVPESVYNLIWHTNDDIQNDRRLTEYHTRRVDDVKGYAKYTNQKLGEASKDYFYPNTAAYSPLAYIPSAAALALSRAVNTTVGQSIFLARLFGLLFYAGVVYLALKSLAGRRFAWVLFAAALIPTAIFQASVISADLMANSLAILLVALVAKSLFDRRLSRIELLAAAAAAFTLPLVKPTYIFLSLAIMLIPGAAIRSHIKFNPHLIKLALLALASGALLFWTHSTLGVSEEIRRMGIGPRWIAIDPSEQTKFVITHPWAAIAVFFRSLLLTDNDYLSGLFGQFGFDFIQVPMASILTSLTAIFIALGLSEKIIASRQKIILAAVIFTAGVGSVFGTLYITFSNLREPVIEGVQGRYFMPFIPLLLLIAVMINGRLKLSNGSNITWLQNSIAILTSISLCLAAFKFFYVMLG